MVIDQVEHIPSGEADENLEVTINHTLVFSDFRFT